MNIDDLVNKFEDRIDEKRIEIGQLLILSAKYPALQATNDGSCYDLYTKDVNALVNEFEHNNVFRDDQMEIRCFVRENDIKIYSEPRTFRVGLRELTSWYDEMIATGISLELINKIKTKFYDLYTVNLRDQEAEVAITKALLNQLSP